MSWKSWQHRLIGCSFWHWIRIACIFSLLWLGSGVTVWSEDAAISVPRPTGYVNDFANQLSAEEQRRLENLSRGLEQATGAELVFVLMPSIAPYDDFTYGMAVFDQWKLGKAGKDNGLLILLAMKERSIRIITGYGLEGLLPDGKLGRYRDNLLIPFLKRGRVADGLTAIGLQIARDIADEAGVALNGPEFQQPLSKRSADDEKLLVFLLIGLLFFMIGFANILIRLGKKNKWGGYGGFGGGFSGGSGFFGSGGGGFGGGYGGFGGGFSGGGGVGGRW